MVLVLTTPMHTGAAILINSLWDRNALLLDFFLVTLYIIPAR